MKPQKSILILGLGLIAFSAEARDEFNSKETTTTVIEEQDSVTEQPSDPLYSTTSDEGSQAYERSVKTTVIEEKEPTYRLNSIRVGLLGGISEMQSGGSQGLAGVAYEFGMGNSPLSLGVSYAVAGPGDNVTRSTLLGKIALQFRSDIPIIGYSYVGANAGWTRDQIDSIGLKEEYFTVGPLLGFDQPVSRHWTAGLEAKYLFSPDNGDNESFSGLAALKYWF